MTIYLNDCYPAKEKTKKEYNALITNLKNYVAELFLRQKK